MKSKPTVHYQMIVHTLDCNIYSESAYTLDCNTDSVSAYTLDCNIDSKSVYTPVSYTHLTLPTIPRV